MLVTPGSERVKEVFIFVFVFGYGISLRWLKVVFLHF